MKRLVPALLLVAVSASAGKWSCDDEYPHSLNVGIPRTAEMSRDRVAQLTQAIRTELIEQLYIDPCAAAALAKPPKPLQINIALGSDYELLDWLARGSIDAAVVSDLSLWLLRRDHVDVRELDPASDRTLSVFPPFQPKPMCARYSRGLWIPCTESPTSAYEAGLAEVWEAARSKTLPRHRFVFASHLSSSGFLEPLEHAAEYFEARQLQGAGMPDAEKLWDAFFSVARFALDSAGVMTESLDDAQDRVEGTTVVFYPGEEMIEIGVGGETIAAHHPNGYREHFVVSAAAADAFLTKKTDWGYVPLDDAYPWNATATDRDRRLLSPRLEKLLAPGDMAGGAAAEVHPPRALESIAQPHPGFGVRTFAFTVGESLRLLRQQQRSSGREDLALVLPGGGVKAAYQSRIVGRLYEDRQLRNREVRGDDQRALVVHSILGTSGGALLGYFVSQLGDQGPFDLYGVLWTIKGKTLPAHKVFGLTDMPRYLSIVLTLVLFAVVFGFFTGQKGSPFYRHEPIEHASWRRRLIWVPLVFMTVPILIRLSLGGETVEHVPVVEGLFYTIMTVMVMWADQCLQYTNDARDTVPSPGHALALFVLGGGLIAFSLTPAAANLRQPTFLFTFFVLSLLFLGCPMLLLALTGRLGTRWKRATEAVGSFAVVLLLCAFGVPGFLPEEFPHILALLLLVLLAVLAYIYARRHQPRRWVPPLLTFLALLLTAILCWSEQRGTGWAPSKYFGAPSLEIEMSSFLISVGTMLLLLSVMVWVYRDRFYAIRHEHVEGFMYGLGFLAVHAIVTGAIVIGLSYLPRVRDHIHGIETTASFWIALMISAVLLAGMALYAAPRVTRLPLKRAMEFLGSEHPNGTLIPRRYTRMVAVAAVSVFWWNFVLAPALYGNANARHYLGEAVQRFDAAFPGGKRAPYIPTAQFIAPTNSLSDDTTQYFMFLCPNDPKPSVASRGARWSIHKTFGPNHDQCGGGCGKFVQDVVFSSGSPFPIFAAHGVKSPEGESLSLIDGGYSNDIPVDAARTIQARQALIVHSASPFAGEHEKHAAKAWWRDYPRPGMLVRNALRLFPFMFERSQQVDRLSSQNLFVVGLAPLLEEGEHWPGLAQFDEPTIDALRREADEDLHQRIGFVESWGEPRFRVSLQCAAPRSAPPATR